MFEQGGIYLDTDIIVVRHLGSLKNTVGDQGGAVINNAVLIFDPKHKFIEACLVEIFTKYNKNAWASNGPGKAQLFHLHPNYY